MSVPDVPCPVSKMKRTKIKSPLRNDSVSAHALVLPGRAMAGQLSVSGFHLCKGQRIGLTPFTSAAFSQDKGGGVATFRVTFSRVVLGVEFPIASIDVRRARDAARAIRAAELRFTRRRCLDDWHYHADAVEVEQVPQ
jgi:hypothetical protein